MRICIYYAQSQSLNKGAYPSVHLAMIDFLAVWKGNITTSEDEYTGYCLNA